MASRAEIEKISESILKLFRIEGSNPLKINEISFSLGIDSQTLKYELMKMALEELIDYGVIKRMPRRKFAMADFNEARIYEGILRYNGFRGMVETKSMDTPNILVKAKDLNTALDGDFVQVKLITDGEKGPRGEVLSVITRSNALIAGTIEYDGNFYFFIPDEDKYYVDFLVSPKNLNKAGDGDKVAVKFFRWDNPQKTPEAEVVQIIGKAGDPVVEYEAIIEEYNLPKKFSADCENQAESIPEPNYDKLKDRLDLRKEITLTIDPPDAKDFDDALSIRKLDNGDYYIGVHIADVSYYVEENSPIDIEAQRRGNSVYLVDRVLPMLPERLSNDLCSLKPNRKRLAYSVMMRMSPEADVLEYEIRETIIKSSKRFSYQEVQNILDAKEGKFAEELLILNDFSKKLRAKRFSVGGIDFETFEIKYELDESKMPIKAHLRRMQDANKLIEEFMLLANKTISEHVKLRSKELKLKENMPFVYRVHDVPNEDKLRDLANFMRSLGFKANFKNSSSKKLNEFISKISESEQKFLIHQIMIRSMAKAEYSPDNIGHYGLGFAFYSHFTSPIRRYPDLIAHRLLKEYAQNKPSPSRVAYLNRELFDICVNCSAQEKLAMDAERASNKVAQTLIAKDRIGEIFEATISGVVHFGVFAMLDEIYSEGLIRLRDLTDDFYIFEPENYRVVGRKHKNILQMGTRVLVKLMKSTTEKRQIDLKLIKILKGEEK